MSAEGPPPYSGGTYPNTQGPQQYPGGQPYGGGPPIIIVQQQQTQQQQQQQQQYVTVRSSGTNHGLCFLLCICTGGLTLPCWIWSCLTD